MATKPNGHVWESTGDVATGHSHSHVSNGEEIGVVGVVEHLKFCLGYRCKVCFKVKIFYQRIRIRTSTFILFLFVRFALEQVQNIFQLETKQIFKHM